MDFRKVCQFCDECASRGMKTVLVLVCAVEGSSMRNPGTIMGVAEDGSFAGSLSGGCIENAVVAEALDALKAGQPRTMRFGAGSPYLDIKLPCGGGIDLYFQPNSNRDVVQACLASIAARQPFSLKLSPDGIEHAGEWQATKFDATQCTGVFGQWPAPRLAIVGHGAGVGALVELSTAMGCERQVWSPDDRVIEQLSSTSTRTTKLERANQTSGLSGDPWTAFVFLFHDHDWELELMAHAITLPHFYIGAMGGRKAHAMRRRALRARGITEEQLFTIRAPIGLFHSSRDPHTLALSALGEIIRAYQEADFEHVSAG